MAHWPFLLRLARGEMAEDGPLRQNCARGFFQGRVSMDFQLEGTRRRNFPRREQSHIPVCLVHVAAGAWAGSCVEQAPAPKAPGHERSESFPRSAESAQDGAAI